MEDLPPLPDWLIEERSQEAQRLIERLSPMPYYASRARMTSPIP
jgi:hypothetical protein